MQRGGNVATEVPRVSLLSFLGTAPLAQPRMQYNSVAKLRTALRGNRSNKYVVLQLGRAQFP